MNEIRYSSSKGIVPYLFIGLGFCFVEQCLSQEQVICTFKVTLRQKVYERVIRYIYFIQDCLLKAQRALAVLYEDRYPCTHWVQQGLSEILYQRCNGSRHEFNDKVLRPTITLLERLKEKVKLFGDYAGGGPGGHAWIAWDDRYYFRLKIYLSGTTKYGIYTLFSFNYYPQIIYQIFKI